MKPLWLRFWSWYEKNIELNRAIVAILFLWQVFHLFWLTTRVVWARIFETGIFNPSSFYELLLVIADYGEVPAIIGGSLLYISAFQKDGAIKNLWFLFFINTQWLHLLWITDEFILDAFGQGSLVGIPYGLAWIAIAIDYLELPVIFDTTKKALTSAFARLQRTGAVGL